MKIYQLFRYPCFMEDEGREDFYGTFNTKEAAETKLQRECKDGYYKPKDFVIRVSEVNDEYHSDSE